MEASVKILKNLVGEFVTADVVKEAAQKDYNQSIWNQTVNRYSTYSETRFFKTPGTIYEFDYYAIYIAADGIRFLQEVTYSSSLTNSGFAFGFFTEGCKDKEAYSKLVEKFPEYKDFDKDSITILQHTEGRIVPNGKGRNFMRTETVGLKTRFFTKAF